jgi:chromosome segregation ATPase
VGIFNRAIFNNAIFNTGDQAQPEVLPGGSGRQYNTTNLELDKWQRQRRRLEAKVEALQEKVEKKRRRLEVAVNLSPARVVEIKLQIQAAHAQILELLAAIDQLRKDQDELEMHEAMVAYMAYRTLH